MVDIFIDDKQIRGLAADYAPPEPIEEFFEYDGPSASLFEVGRLLSFDTDNGAAMFYGRVTKVELISDTKATISFLRTLP